MLLDKLREIYHKYGNRAVCFPLFLAFFALNFIGGLGMTYPATDPNELSVIAVSQFFAGKSWSGVMCSVDYYYGFLQGLIYTPVMLLFSSPELQYGAILFINAALISIVPVIAYMLAFRMKVNKLWKMLVTALVAGGYCCYYAHSKFAWTETLSILLPWLIILIAFRCGDCKNRNTRFFMSLLLGFVCGVSPAAHTRLLAVVAALIAALALERFMFGKKLVSPVAFLLSFVITCILVVNISYYLQLNLWCQSDPALLKNTLAEFFVNFGGNLANDGAVRLAQTLSGQLYYFVTSTWGFGAVMFCLTAAVISACIKHKKKKEPHTYELELSVFSVFTLLTVLLTVIFSTLYRFSYDGYYVYQDTVMFGRFLDGVIPFALAFVLIMLFTHSISINKVLGAVIVLGVIYFAFFFSAIPTILECSSTRISPVLALYPLRVGAASAELLTAESFFLTMSMTFCVMGLLIVVISCSKKYRSTLISLFMAGLTVYSLVFISVVYLPMCRNESIAKNSDIAHLSESVFNQDGAPAVTALNLSRHEALMLQFLNNHVTVRVTYSIENVPENSFLAVRSGEDVSALENSHSSPFLLVAESGGLRLYAYGERALAYLQSQDVDETEDNAETLIPEKTVPSSTAPPATLPPDTEPPATVTDELIPTDTTVSLPSVLTTPPDAADRDSEWAILE